MAQFDNNPYPAHEWAYLRLRQFVLSPRTPPGALLKSRLLAKEFQIGRLQLRSALVLLTRQGLLELKPGTGYFTTLPAKEDIHGLYVMNGYLVQGCLSDMAQSRAPAKIEVFAREASEPRKMRAPEAEAQRLADFTAALFWFICKQSDSESVLDALSLITDRLRPLRIAEFQVFPNARNEIADLSDLLRRRRYADLINARDNYHSRRVGALNSLFGKAYGLDCEGVASNERRQSQGVRFEVTCHSTEIEGDDIENSRIP